MSELELNEARPGPLKEELAEFKSHITKEISYQLAHFLQNIQEQAANRSNLTDASLLSELPEQIQNLTRSVSGLEISIEQLQEQVSGIDQKVSKLDTKVSDLDGRVSKLSTSVSDLDKQFDEKIYKLSTDIKTSEEKAKKRERKLKKRILNHVDKENRMRDRDIDLIKTNLSSPHLGPRSRGSFEVHRVYPGRALNEREGDQQEELAY